MKPVELLQKGLAEYETALRRTEELYSYGRIDDTKYVFHHKALTKKINEYKDAIELCLIKK
jgi:hypothetical protein